MALTKCEITVDRSQCEDIHQKCKECPFKETCDGHWITALWNKIESGKDRNTMGVFDVGSTKDNIRSGHYYTYGIDKDNFIDVRMSKRKNYIVIDDLYISPEARGKGYSKILINEIQEMFEGDIFLKCLRDTSAEKFWKHNAIQVQPTFNEGDDMYEHRFYPDGRPRRDLAWFRIPYNKGIQKNNLWE